MGFQLTPITDRQVKYATAIWDFDNDGGWPGDTTKVYPKRNQSIPKNAVIVSALMEQLESMPDGFFIGRLWVGAEDITGLSVNMGVDMDMIHEIYAPTLTPKKTTGGYVGIDFMEISGQPTSGLIAITVGYLESIL